MGFYYGLRGWLEIDDDGYKAVKNRLAELQERHSDNVSYAPYMRCWCWNSFGVNWTNYIFYGGDVKQYGLDLLEETLEELTSLKLHLSGYFHAQGEDHTISYVYKIENDKVSVSESTALIEDLDDDRNE